MLALFAVGSIAAIVVFRTLAIIIWCSVILAISVGFIIYFIAPRRTKDSPSVEDITKSLMRETEVLWEGQTSKIGGIMLSAKISLLIALVFEIIFVIIAAFFDIGLSDKLKTFFALQVCLIMPVIIFIIGCFQTTGFSYRITNERVYIYSDFGKLSAVYDIKDILDIKVKYGFYERDKKHGTIKVKVRNRRFAPRKNYLYSMPNPEGVLTIIQRCMDNATEQE